MATRQHAHPEKHEEKKMEFSNSDCNLTMLATETFDNILEQIKTSCLNFHMQISPFSAVISLKKSLIKDRSGKPRIPTEPSKSDSEHVEALVKKNHELERKLRVITDEHTKLKDTCAEASKTIEILKKDLETSDNEMREVKDAQILVKADLDNANKEILDQQKKIEVLNKKDLELEDMKKENIELERKVNSLFDTLYGCEECGYHGDFCKCDGKSDGTKEVSQSQLLKCWLKPKRKGVASAHTVKQAGGQCCFRHCNDSFYW